MARPMPKLPVEAQLKVPLWSGYVNALVESLLRSYKRAIYFERNGPVDTEDGRVYVYNLVAPEELIDEIGRRFEELDEGAERLVTCLENPDVWLDHAADFGVYGVKLTDEDGDVVVVWTGPRGAMAEFSFAIHTNVKLRGEDLDA